MLRQAARQLAGRCAISSRDSDACVCTSAPCSSRQAGDRLEQLARARDREARRERRAQPAVARRRASACAMREALVDRRAASAPAAAPAPRRRRPSCTCRSSRAGRSRPTASNTASVSCTVSIVSTVVVPLAAARSAASRAAARSDAGVCAASIGQTRVPQPVHQRQVVGVAAEERLAEVDVRLDEAGQDVAAARVDDAVVRAGDVARRWRRCGRRESRRRPRRCRSASFIVRIVPLRIRRDMRWRTAKASTCRLADCRLRVALRQLHGGVQRIAAGCSLPCFTAISSARMLTAISCGVTAPMSRPIGAWTRCERLGAACRRPTSAS